MSVRVDIGVQSYQKEFVDNRGAQVFSQVQQIFLFPGKLELGSNVACAF